MLRAPSHGVDPQAFTRRVESELKTFFLGEDHFKTLEVAGVNEAIDAAELLGTLSDPALDEAEAAWSSRQDERPQIRIDLQPVWCTSSQRTALHFAYARTSPVASPDGSSSGRSGPDVKLETLMEHDVEVLRRACEILDTPARPPEAVAVAAPVHFSTLSSPRVRMAYAARLAERYQSGRKNLLLRIIRTPDAAPSGRYAEVAYLARRLAPRALLDVTFTGFRPDRFQDARFDAFILTAPDGERRLPTGDHGFDRFRLSVKRLGSAWGVDGCWSADEAQAYSSAGALFISGPWLGPAIAGAAPRQID